MVTFKNKEDSVIWIMHKLQVRAEVGPIKHPDKNDLYDQFGDLQYIVESTEKVLEEVFGFPDADEDVEGMLQGLMGMDIDYAIKWDIIPPKEGIRLIIYIVEERPGVMPGTDVPTKIRHGTGCTDIDDEVVEELKEGFAEKFPSNDEIRVTNAVFGRKPFPSENMMVIWNGDINDG